jgi:hypothetical protein
MFKLGADPEIFLSDATDALISALDKFGGTKWEPKPMGIGDGFMIQEDNVAVEYNIPPADSQEVFRENIAKAMTYIKEQAEKYSLKFSLLSAASFPVDQLKDVRALTFGCDPDFNAWEGGKPNPRPRATDKTLRSAGGHIHIGYEFENRLAAVNFIKHLDLFLAVPSVLMDDGTRRRELYGNPGAFRYKEYGVEYRVLSNFWIFKPELVDWVYNNTSDALETFLSGDIKINKLKNDIINTVKKSDRARAQQLVQQYHIDLV